MKKDESVLRYISATLAAETCILHRDGRAERIESYSTKQNALITEEDLRKTVLSLYGAEIPILLNWNDLYFGIVNLPDKQIVAGPIALAAPIRCNFRRRGEQTELTGRRSRRNLPPSIPPFSFSPNTLTEKLLT